jgi:arabinoxylan arabinofuranohydrolase
LIDDDGSAYLYFGGGIPGKEYAHPRTARAVKLGADMVSVVGDPVTIDAPYLFEDSGIHKIGSAYYYSYCTNWQVPPEATSQYGFSSGQIAYMTSDNPLGPFTYRGMFLKNPGATFGDWGNNHHCVFSFRDEWFVAYHARLLESRMGILKGYRSVNVDRLSVGADGALLPVTPTRAGISQLAAIDAYSRVNATTASAQAGVDVVGSNPKSRYFGSGAMSVAGMSGGSWVFVEGVDFGETGPASFVANLRRVSGAPGSILVRLDGEGGDLLATVDSLSVADDDGYHEVVAKVTKKITGKHDVFFEFTGGGFEWDSWAFNR